MCCDNTIEPDFTDPDEYEKERREYIGQIHNLGDALFGAEHALTGIIGLCATLADEAFNGEEYDLMNLSCTEAMHLAYELNIRLAAQL